MKASHILPIVALIPILMASPGHSLVILSDDLGDLKGISVLTVSRYSKKLCKDCTNRSILPRAWNGLQSFSESDFAFIMKGKGYLPNPNDMLNRMHSLLRTLRKAADPDDGIYELTLLREIISNQEFLTQKFIDQIAQTAQDAVALELATKYRLFEQNSVSPSDTDVFKTMCPTGKKYEACNTKNMALIFLNRFFTQIIEQFSFGAKFGKSEQTLYGALQERLKKLEAAHR
jgi:hypothetical protein